MGEDARTLKELIEASDNIVFFGGAGVSTESGIPDFRSKDGLYNQHDVRFDMYQPEYLLSHSCLIYEPKVYYEFHRQKMDTRSIEPNNAHRYLAELEKLGKLKAVVTQNIDGLHQAAGSARVFELHGSVHRNFCTRCRSFYPLETVLSSDGIPLCPKDGKVIKPDVVLYEEPLDENVVEGAVRSISEADLMVIVGSSLTVYPAASFVRYFRGRTLAVINMTPTDYDRIAQIKLYEDVISVVRDLKEQG